MKKIVVYIVTFVISTSLINCSLENNDTDTPTRSPKWSLVNVTGGVAGIDETLELGQITWVFNDLNNTLLVEEHVEGLSYGLPEGNYSYSIENISNADFLFIDDVEYGDIIIGRNTFTIDQNRSSTNTNNADKFVFKFVR